MALGPLVRTCFRAGKTQPLRTGLMILGIALGVAGVVAIDMARTSVGKSFELSTAALTTRASHQIMGNDFSIPQNLFTRLRTELGLGQSAPVISSLVRLDQAGGRTLTLMGVDPFSESAFRPMTRGLGTAEELSRVQDILGLGQGVVMGRNLALVHGLEPGDMLDFSFGETRKTVALGAVIGPDNAAASPLDGILLADISLAQEILEMGDRITRIDLILPDGQTAGEVREMLGPGQVLVDTAARNQTIRQLSVSFETSLTAFSMLVLFMGIFLIYNTVSFSVSRRRRLNGIFRALGADRRHIFLAVQTEVMTYALAGSALGLILGMAMGKGAVEAVCATVSDMYYTLTVSQIHISWVTLAKGLGVGLSAAFAASFVPALNAANTTPITLMQTLVRQKGDARRIRWLAGAGALILGAALWIFTWPRAGMGMVFLGIFAAFAGASLVCPLLIDIITRNGAQAAAQMEKSFPSFALAAMGIRNLARSLGRSAVLIASLMVVISVYIGIDSMTGSFRASVASWVDGHIGGDVHVESLDKLAPVLDPKLPSRIAAMDQVSDVSAYNIHRSFSSVSGEVHVFSFIKDLSSKTWTWTAPEAKGDTGVRPEQLLDRGWIMVSEIFARQHGLPNDPGSRQVSVTMDTLKGRQTFRVAGIFRDFFMGGGRAVVSREAMRTFWGKDEITAIQVFVKGRTRAEKQAAVEKVMAGIRAGADRTEPLRLRSGAVIKQSILAVFDRTFLITIALQFLTALVALTGIVNSIMAMVLERSRELAVLRACGAEQSQIRSLILWESGACGLMAGIFALPLGLFLSWVLVDVVNFRAFGWTYDLQISWLTLVLALGFSFAAALASGLLPAARAGQISLAQALRTE